MKPTDPAREQIGMEIQKVQNRLRADSVSALLHGLLNVSPMIQEHRGERRIVWIVNAGNGALQVLDDDGLFDFARQLSEVVRR